jgi:hypothetical protein
MEIEYLQFWSMSFLVAKEMATTASQVSSIYSFGSTPSLATEEMATMPQFIISSVV